MGKAVLTDYSQSLQLNIFQNNFIANDQKKNEKTNSLFDLTSPCLLDSYKSAVNSVEPTLFLLHMSHPFPMAIVNDKKPLLLGEGRSRVSIKKTYKNINHFSSRNILVCVTNILATIFYALIFFFESKSIYYCY